MRPRSTWGGNFTTVSVYLTDAKRIDPPTKEAPPTPAEPTTAETLETMAQELKAQNPLPTPYTPRQRDERIPSDDELHTLKASAAAGVAVVVARYWGAMEQKTRLRIQATSSVQSDGLRSGRNSPR